MPFTLSPGKTISLSQDGYQGKIGRRKFNLTGKDSSYLFEVFGFPDEETAETFLQRLGGGLLWAQVTVDAGIEFDLSLQELRYYEDQVADSHDRSREDKKWSFDCGIDGARSAIYPSDRRIASFIACPVTVSLGIGADTFCSALLEGFYLPNAADIIGFERIKLASELYSQAHLESSLKARFLTQMTVLEILSEQPNHPNYLLNLINDWLVVVDDKRRSSKDADEKKRLDRLRTRVCDLKKESIRESVSILVGKALAASGDSKTSELVRRIGSLYRVRSAIAHGRPITLGRSPAELNEIVCKVLHAVMKQPSLLTKSNENWQPTEAGE